MRILFLVPWLSGGGAERQLSYVAAELQRRGHDVCVGHIEKGPGLWPDSIPTHRFAVRGAWDPMLVVQIARLIRSWKPDLVQTNLTMMDVAGGIACRWMRVPLVMREAISGDDYAGFRKWLRERIVRAAACAIVANSPGGIDYWAQHAPHIRRALIRNAVPVDAIERTAPIARSDDGALGVYVAQLHPRKNADILLRAAAIVMSERPLRLIICGDGVERASLERLANDLGIATRVSFEGFVNDVWPFQRGADFTALLSSREGHPNAALEAFAAGTPIILSDIPPHRALGDDMALFVPLRDVEATARAIRATLDDRAAARARAARARALVALLSIGAVVDQLEALYVQCRA